VDFFAYCSDARGVCKGKISPFRDGYFGMNFYFATVLFVEIEGFSINERDSILSILLSEKNTGL